MIKITNSAIRLGEDVEFSWKLLGDECQVSYQIDIWDWKKNLVWTTGQVKSHKRHNRKYHIALQKESIYEWRVRVVGSKGSMADYQGEKIYTQIEDWKAKWVEPGRSRKPLTDSTEPIEPVAKGAAVGDSLDKLDPVVYIRKEFVVDEMPVCALAYGAAHGVYALYINGCCVSELFAPGNTSYEKHIDYQCYDVTHCLKKGKNVMALSLADGWYTGKIGAVGIGQQFGKENAVIGQLMMEKPDHTKTYIVTDEDALWSEGALRYADLYIGEYFDANMEKTGWNQSGFLMDDTWKPVVVKEYGYENLAKQGIPGICEIRQITPRVITAPNGDLLLDTGENIVGIVSVRTELKEGQILSLEHSETLDANGNYVQNIIGQNKDQTDYYVAAKNGICEYCPQFSYHGFRYVRVKGTTDTNPEHYTVHVIGTPLNAAGEFRCSNEGLNLLQESIKRSQEGNMISIPTDCPQRERVGWLGDVQVFTPTGCYEYDIEEFLRHWMIDVRWEQLENGEVPHIVPYMKSHDIMKPPGLEGVSAAGWSDAAVIVPWRLYEAYGDVNILRENFQLMKRYMASTEERVAELPAGYEEMDEKQKERQTYLWNTGFQYGDWLMPSIQMSGRSIFEVVKETGYVIATLMYALTTEIMAEICGILGEDTLRLHYQKTNEKVKKAFAEEYVKEDGTIKKDYQGVYVLALKAEAIPTPLRENALDRLVQLIHENNDLLDTGFLSVPYLLPVLKKYGRGDIANLLLFRDECPSWLYEIKMGATTMWEYWNGYANDGTPSDCSMNHFAFGCVGEYFFHDILGIKSMEPGFGCVAIEPDFNCGLSFAEGSYASIWGAYHVKWRKNVDDIDLEIVVPPDAKAVINYDGIRREYSCGKYLMKIKGNEICTIY